MISVIVCSVSEQRLSALRANVEATVGVPFEIIAIDNSKGGYSLASAYNEGARRAKYDYLCFAHEDIAFYNNGWGLIISQKLRESSTGYIGFAGSVGKPAELTAWYFSAPYRRMNLVETTSKGARNWRQNPENERFSEVVTLDGMCLMVSATTYRAVPFDEEVLTGFHFYDLDVTVAAFSKGYHNYVCQCVEVEHFSEGSYNRSWYEWAKIFSKKWNGKLPLYTQELTASQITKNEKVALRSMTYLLIKKRILTRSEARKRVCKVIKNSPFAIKSYLLWIILQKNLCSLQKNI